MYAHLITGLVAASHLSGARAAPASSSANILAERADANIEVNTGSEFWASVPRRDAFAMEEATAQLADKRDETITVETREDSDSDETSDTVSDEVEEDDETSAKGGSSSSGGGGRGGSGGRRGGGGGVVGDDDDEDEEGAAPRYGVGLPALAALVAGWVVMGVAM